MRPCSPEEQGGFWVLVWHGGGLALPGLSLVFAGGSQSRGPLWQQPRAVLGSQAVSVSVSAPGETGSVLGCEQGRV